MARVPLEWDSAATHLPTHRLIPVGFRQPRQKFCQELQHEIRQQSCHECLREWACKPSSLQSHFTKPGLALQRVFVQDLLIILPRVSPRLAKNLSKSMAKTAFFCTAGVSNPHRSFDMRLVKVGTLPFGSLWFWLPAYKKSENFCIKFYKFFQFFKFSKLYRFSKFFKFFELFKYSKIYQFSWFFKFSKLFQTIFQIFPMFWIIKIFENL